MTSSCILNDVQKTSKLLFDAPSLCCFMAMDFTPTPAPKPRPKGGAKRRLIREWCEAPPRPTARNALSAEGAIGWAKSRITETRSHEERTGRNTCILCTAKTKIRSAAWPARAKEFSAFRGSDVGGSVKEVLWRFLTCRRARLGEAQTPCARLNYG